MRQRGRKSSDAIRILRLPPAARQPPPASLSAAEAKEWVAIIDRMPGGWFGRETHALLTNFCRHVAEADKITGMIALLDEGLADAAREGRGELELICESMDARDRLLRMRERETRAIASLAVKMRLSQSAALDKTKAGSAQRREGPVPWEMSPETQPKIRP
jgi:hypothetical protein